MSTLRINNAKDTMITKMNSPQTCLLCPL